MYLTMLAVWSNQNFSFKSQCCIFGSIIEHDKKCLNIRINV